MKEIRDKILRRWWAFPLFTIGFGLILSVGITNSWANGWLWMWLCLIVIVSVVQLYIMLQCIKEHECFHRASAAYCLTDLFLFLLHNRYYQ